MVLLHSVLWCKIVIIEKQTKRKKTNENQSRYIKKYATTYPVTWHCFTLAFEFNIGNDTQSNLQFDGTRRNLIHLYAGKTGHRDT